MGQAAADRAAVTDRGMADMANRIPQQRSMSGDFRRPLQIDMARQRTDGENATFHGDTTQVGKVADVDNQFWGNQPQIHGRHQALAA